MLLNQLPDGDWRLHWQHSPRCDKQRLQQVTVQSRHTRMIHAADYFFSLHNYFSFIIVLVCVAFIFHLIITKFTLYPLLDYTLYQIIAVYLLQPYKHTSVDAPYD